LVRFDRTEPTKKKTNRNPTEKCKRELKTASASMPYAVSLNKKYTTTIGSGCTQTKDRTRHVLDTFGYGVSL
jgi:hypothetical protein